MVDASYGKRVWVNLKILFHRFTAAQLYNYNFKNRLPIPTWPLFCRAKFRERLIGLQWGRASQLAETAIPSTAASSSSSAAAAVPFPISAIAGC